MILYCFNKITIKIYNLIGWFLSLFFMALVLFGVYPNFHENPLNHETQILYEAFSKLVWSLGLSFIIFSCHFNGGFANKCFSWSVWVPLSRISFSIYLFHSNVVYYYYYSQSHKFFYSDLAMVN
jgi:peptidoglycan/LPS O-acetylase OafA/YrhL